jgi:cytochrome P450
MMEETDAALVMNMDLFSDEMRRNPFSMYDAIRSGSPVVHIPPPFDAWAVFDYAGVKRVMSDHEAFSSQVPAPRNWFLFLDPPKHTKLRALVSRAFTPGTIAGLAPRIRSLSRELLDQKIEFGAMDLAGDLSVPLPMMVIAEMIGIPADDWAQFNRWSETILNLSHSRSGGAEASEALGDFVAATAEMDAYLTGMLEARRAKPQADLLTRLVEAEVDGERLTQEEILGFFQLLILAGQETTTNLINNAVICLIDHPDQFERLRANPALLPSAIEEVLRFRSPFLWMMRTPRLDVELNGATVPAGALVLAMVASANRDPGQFEEPSRFDISRDPNPHLSFGHGIHFCIGAALARMEATIVLSDLLERLEAIEYASQEPWTPRKALHVHGPSSLPIRFVPRR